MARILGIIPAAHAGAALKAAAISNAGPKVRRPTRGITLKEETFATLQVITAGNEPIPLVDAGSRARDKSNGPLEINGKRANDVYSNFLLQNIQENRAEKQQILETFGEPYIFLFGERARIMMFEGVLANTFDFNWEAEWWHNYDNYLRGTKCVENDAMAFLTFDGTIIGGYIIQAAATKSAQERNFVHFQFQMFVTYYAPLTDVGNPNAEDLAARPTDVNAMQRTYSLSAAEAAVWRPPILAPMRNFAIQLPTRPGFNGITVPDLLYSALNWGTNPFRAAWNLAKNTIQPMMNQINNHLNGGFVDVPYGFAGTMAYDEVDLSEFIKEVEVGGTVKYTTFGDNNDEFVGGGDYQFGYADSVPDAFGDYLHTLGEPENAFGDSNVVAMATKTWEDTGVIVDPVQQGPLSSFIAARGMGMIFVGSARDTKRTTVLAGGTELVGFQGGASASSMRVFVAETPDIKIGVARLINLVGSFFPPPTVPPLYR